MAGLGGALTVGMGVILVWIASVMAHSNDPGVHAKFTGGLREQLFIIGILGIVICFGLASLTAGIAQIVTGRRNRMLAAIVLGLGAILVVISLGFAMMR
jgi:hypothetical protein